MRAFRQVVEARLPVTPVPGLSSLRLRLANEKSGLGRLLAEMGSGLSPYWAHVWAGGLALARHIEAAPDTVRGRSVIDYGTGSGLVAIAAAKAGAREVIACDLDPLALETASINAALNGVEITPHRIERDRDGSVLLATLGTIEPDFPAQPPNLLSHRRERRLEAGGDAQCRAAAAKSKPTIVLAGDVFYDPETADQTLAALRTLADAGADILIGDPFRAHLPQQRLALVARYTVADFAAAGKPVAAGVFTLRRASTACS